VGSDGHRAATRMAGRLWWLPLAPLGFISDRGSRLRWLFMPAIVLTTAFTSSAVKLLVRRPRPNAPYRRAPLWNLDAAGFPSTHSACAFAVAGWMRGSRHARPLRLIAFVISCLRVQRRAHHLADVVAGGRSLATPSSGGSSVPGLGSPREVRTKGHHAPQERLDRSRLSGRRSRRRCLSGRGGSAGTSQSPSAVQHRGSTR
jgi:hypothetical protein